MKSRPRGERYDFVVRLFFGAGIGVFVGLMTCFRIRTISTREPWPWFVLPMVGLLIGLIVAWWGQRIRRNLQRWLWWFP